MQVGRAAPTGLWSPRHQQARASFPDRLSGKLARSCWFTGGKQRRTPAPVSPRSLCPGLWITATAVAKRMSSATLSPARVRAAASSRLARLAPPHALAYSPAARRIPRSLRSVVPRSSAPVRRYSRSRAESLPACLPAVGRQLRGQCRAVAGVISGHLQGDDGHDVLQLAGLGLVVDLGAWLVNPDVPADHLIPFGLVTSAGEAPVAARPPRARAAVEPDPPRRRQDGERAPETRAGAGEG